MTMNFEQHANALLHEWRSKIVQAVSQYDRRQVQEAVPDAVPFLDGYRGNGSAAPEEIASAEYRLGLKLPPDYVAFLRVTNGWSAPMLGGAGNRLLPVEEIGLYRELYPESYAAWTINRPSDLREQVGVYGDKQLPEQFAASQLHSCIAITTQDASEAFVLNPEMRHDGLLEAWWLGFSVPGAFRFRSFFSLLEFAIQRSIEEVSTALAG